MKRAPSGYPFCAVPGCPYLGTNRGFCIPHWKTCRQLELKEPS